MEKPLVVGNWKMELSFLSAQSVAKSMVKDNVGDGVDVIACPSFESLSEVGKIFKDSGITLGAQDVHWEELGARTGEVSAASLKELVDWCIVGHSERRAMGETDELVARKIGMLLKHRLRPIICLGENKEQRDGGQATEVIREQMASILEVVQRSDLPRVAIAYEPVWAIGTGVVPQAGEIFEMMLWIRKLVTERYDQEIAERTRLLYGGSVKVDNIEGIMKEPGVDGVLVGGASIRPQAFKEIINKAKDSYV